MKPKAFLRLEKSEGDVVHAASRIFAAYITSGTVDENNEEEMMLRSIHHAIRIAVTTDRLVQSDDEQSLSGIGLPLD